MPEGAVHLRAESMCTEEKMAIAYVAIERITAEMSADNQESREVYERDKCGWVNYALSPCRMFDDTDHAWDAVREPSLRLASIGILYLCFIAF